MTIKIRNQEYKYIRNVVQEYNNNKKSTGLYLCGVPGSGKTYTINEALKETSHVFLNCSLFKNKTRVYNSILSNLICSKKPPLKRKKSFSRLTTSNKINHFELLMKHFEKCSSEHIIVLDEIDLLKTKDQSILYNLFSLPTYPNISLLLVTISNSFNLDLDSKILSRQGNKKLLFTPYKNEQLIEILSEEDKKIDKKTLNKKEFISRRVAAVSGDARKAIRLYKNTEKLSIEQISKKINECENMLPKLFLQSLTEYHKIFLMLFFHKKTINEAFSGYDNFCKAKKLVELDFLEFIKMLTFLKNTGIICINRDKINYLFIKEEIECYLKQEKIIKLFL